MAPRNRFDLIDQEQLAAQIVAMMDAHFQRPSTAEKLHILSLAAHQMCGLSDDAQVFEAVQARLSELRAYSKTE
jgi:hypothetical protein